VRFIVKGIKCGELICSRTPSRSPHRSQTDSVIGTSTPSTRPSEPTIREETQASVSKVLNARHTQSPPDTAPLSGHASRSSAPSASSNGAPRSKSKYRMVGDWQLQKTLGAGSMGKVKLGVNIHTREKVSISSMIWTDE
jgi:hypothetical protein